MSTAVTLRMYAVGFGDCFLVTLRHDDTVWRMLVDCGVHGLGRGEHDMDTIVGDVIDTCRDTSGTPRIDVVVATHRHRDHVSGFGDERWAEVEVGEVWLPWCEDPEDREALAIRGRLDSAANALHLGFEATDPVASGMALNSLTNERAMWTLSAGFAGEPQRRYLSADGLVREEIDTVPDARTYLLGPPRSKEAIVAMNPPKLERWLRLADSSDSGADDSPPFGPGLEVDPETYATAYPHLVVNSKLLERMRADPPDALAATSWLDNALNNTSVMFVLEVGDTRLLFPGDAQWGAWREVLDDADARALLAKTTLYKVSHHGSHNGSPRTLVESVLPQTLTSVVSVRDMSNWKSIPKAELVGALTGENRRVLRSDRQTSATAVPAELATRVADDGLWSEIDLGEPGAVELDVEVDEEPCTPA